jgi:hypothetical protein
MIDNEIRIKKGISYIKKALKIEPKSIFYIDSLAWGYYKLKQCKKAYFTLNKILINNKYDSNSEIFIHLNLIKKCYLKKNK